jgi:hypothetical protein
MGTLLDVVAETLIVPLKVAPFAGAVIETVGTTGDVPPDESCRLNMSVVALLATMYLLLEGK